MYTRFPTALVTSVFALVLGVFSNIMCVGVASSTTLEVVIAGVKGALRNNVEKSLGILQLPHSGDVLDRLSGRITIEFTNDESTRLQRYHSAASREIESALQPFGYYNAEVTTELLRFEEKWRATYTISPGEPVLIKNVELGIVGEGAVEASLNKVSESTRLQLGRPLNHQHYGDTKSALLKRSIELGYLNAKYSVSELRVDTKQNTADIVLNLDTGERFYFGEIIFKQNVLSDSVIRRYLTFSKGDRYDATKLVQLQLALNDTQYFRRIEIDTARGRAVDNSIPIIITALAQRPRLYALGIGMGTDTGPRLKLGTKYRRINRRGHSVNADFLLSDKRLGASAQYEIPLAGNRTDKLRLVTRYEDEVIGDDGRQKRLVLGATYHDRWGRWQRRLYIDYSDEKNRFGETTSTPRSLVPGITLTYAKADNLLLPHRGRSWFLDLHGSSNTLFSDATFIQARVVGQQVWSPREKLRILGKFEIGATGIDSFADLPASQRFFAGGDQSVRGYAYRSIGSRENGNVVGGRYLSTLSLEADYLVYKDFGAALFLDAGDASRDFSFDWQKGGGIGFRWQTPVGMFRFDVAIPLDAIKRSPRYHLSIGADL